MQTKVFVQFDDLLILFECVLRRLICLSSLKSTKSHNEPSIPSQYSLWTASRRQDCHRLLSHSSNGNTEDCNWCGWETNLQAIKMNSLWWSAAMQMEPVSGLNESGRNRSQMTVLFTETVSSFLAETTSDGSSSLTCVVQTLVIYGMPREQSGSRYNSRACVREGWGHGVIRCKL